MPFIEAKCTNCGAVLPVDSTREAWICGYCGTPFVVEKAIQQYNTTIHVDTMVVQGGKADFDISGGVLRKYNGNDADVVVPEGVLKIGEAAFKDCAALESVKLPDSLEEIRKETFMNCVHLKSITFPPKLYFGYTLPWLGWSAFEGCKDLVRVTFKTRVYKDRHCRSTSFSLCPSLKEIVTYKPNVYFLESDLNLKIIMPDDLTEDEQKRWICIQEYKCYYCGGEIKFFGKNKCKSCGKLQLQHACSDT